MVLGILAFVVVPQFSEASSNTKQSRLRSGLGIVRQKLELYKIEHEGRYPPADSEQEFIAQLTQKTSRAGEVVKNEGEKDLFGPYLQNIPVNPYTNGKRVKCGGTADSGKADWSYDPQSDRFSANRPVSVTGY